KLAAITVDVSTVEMPELAGELDAARIMPLPTVDPEQFAMGQFSYETTVTLGEQQMQIPATRLIEMTEMDGESVLRIHSTSQGPMGEASDELILDAENLRPLSRLVNQAGATITVSFDSREVSGAIEAGGQTIPISIELEAPLIAGEAGLEAVLASLPLTEGYRTSLRVAEIGAQQRVRFFAVEVEGSDEIEVPAGNFEAWRISVSALDNEGGDQTIWMNQTSPRMMVKTEGRLPPQMGGMAYTTVLTERP
ncbi:MAG: hypothetical protein V2J20_08905, partial [Wenzhouxiangella sp.]|nr:hypothetical protein [Wenzhouxiangella sp.]